MPHYQVRYSLGPNNEYEYPKSVAGTVWKSVVYHYSDRVMVGETDSEIAAGGKEAVGLTPDQAAKLEKEYRSSYPKLEVSPEVLSGPSGRLPSRTSESK